MKYLCSLLAFGSLIFSGCPHVMWSIKQDTKLTSGKEAFSEPETTIYS